MKKHLIVAGPPRTGKSTLCRLISQKLGYQHVSMDAVVDALIACFPQVGLDSRTLPDLEGLRAMSRKIAPFLQALTEGGEYDEMGYGMVLDICQVFPEDLARALDRSQFGVCFLITAQETPAQRLALLDRFDQPKDYSFHQSPEERRALCAHVVAVSRVLKEECRRWGFSCFETGRNRSETLDSLVETLQQTGDFPAL